MTRNIEHDITDFGLQPKRHEQLVSRLRRFERPLTIVSAASHNGCEPLTLAMHLVDQNIDARIIAHDGRPDRYPVLSTAEYLKTEVDMDFKLDRLPPRFRRFFVPTEDPERWAMHPEIRARVTYPGVRRLPYEGIEPADVYLLRNLWIHIHPEERIEVVRRLHDAMPADGIMSVRTAHPDEVRRTADALDRDRYYLWSRPHADAGARLRDAPLEPARDPLYARWHGERRPRKDLA